MLKTALMLLPLFLIAALGFWIAIPGKTPQFLISDQEKSAEEAPSENINELNDKLSLLENKVNLLETSNSALLSKISGLESGNSGNTVTVTPVSKSPVLIPINPGGSVNSTTWTNLTSGSITVDPANYPGYKNAYLIINLSVYQGQGTAYAQLVNTQNTLAIIPSQVSTTSFSPVGLTSQGFKLPEGSNTYTVQLYTQVSGYPAQAGDSFLQITYN
jgi:hypothetical protein